MKDSDFQQKILLAESSSPTRQNSCNPSNNWFASPALFSWQMKSTFCCSVSAILVLVEAAETIWGLNAVLTCQSKFNFTVFLDIISGLLIFRAVAEPRIWSKSVKSREIHKNTWNPAKFARNLTKYVSAQHIWKLSWLLGRLTCCKLANLLWNFVTTAGKQHLKTTRRS